MIKWVRVKWVKNKVGYGKKEDNYLAVTGGSKTEDVPSEGSLGTTMLQFYKKETKIK